MRKAYKVWIGIAATVFCVVAVSDLGRMASKPPTPPSVAALSAPAYSAPIYPSSTYPPYSTPTAATPIASDAGGDTVVVTRVIDGDTFDAGNVRVRVLGIDSCEANTSGGKQATQQAQSTLAGQSVTLRTEQGVDKDKYGRALRYVTLSNGADFGEWMVMFDHTGVYQGHNDASKAYLAQLRTDDTTGRTCSSPSPKPSSDSSNNNDDHDDDHDVNLPDGALTGGYCARKWWC